MSDKAPTDKTATDKTATDKTATDKTATDKTATDKTATDKTATDKTATDKTATDKTATDKTATDKTATDKTATDKVPSEADAEGPRIERVEIVTVPTDDDAPDQDGSTESPPRESVSEPAKVMRVGSMIKQLLEEVRSTELDEPSRERVKEIYETSVRELATALSPDLQAELGRLALPFDDDEVPSEAELRVAKAQLVGWLEGLFHGIQATLFAQQMAARQQLDGMRGQLPPGAEVEHTGPAGQYL